MNERTSSTRVVEAPLGRVLDVIAELSDYPSWATQFTAATVQERYPSGRPKRAEFVMDAGILKDTFTLQYTFTESEQGALVMWHLVSANFLKKLDGLYRLTPTNGGTRTQVHYELEVDPGLPVLTLLRRRAEATVIRTALGDLAAAVEHRPQEN